MKAWMKRAQIRQKLSLPFLQLPSVSSGAPSCSKLDQRGSGSSVKTGDSSRHSRICTAPSRVMWVQMSFFSALTHYIASHPHLVYAAIFLLALSESVPVIGAVVPGTAIIVGLAALVPSGVFTLWPMLLSAFLGAIVGDGLSFWLGHRYHREILLRWPLNRYPELIAGSEAFGIIRTAKSPKNQRLRRWRGF